MQWLVVTLTPEGHIPLSVYKLLAQHPTLSILALSSDGSRAEIQALRRGGEFHRARVNNMTLTMLMALLQRQPLRHQHAGIANIRNVEEILGGRNGSDSPLGIL